MVKPMLILGIESSCDETAVALVKDGHDISASEISSQVALHAGYGGVIPELAAREHLRNITPIIETILERTGLTLAAIDGIAVTHRPGLIPALLVGNVFAKGLAATLQKPIIGINHFEAHIYGAFLGHPEILADPANFPVLAVVVSGGHTALVLIAPDGEARIIGATLDDAAGEALDKAAKILNLGYPGGPIIDRLARQGNPLAWNFPQGLTGAAGKAVPAEHRYNFSFSGVKTALLYAVRGRELSQTDLCDVAASYQRAIMEVLQSKAIAAAHNFGARLICLCGGVACNSYLRQRFREETESRGMQLRLAPPKFCTDNAAMVAGLGWHYLHQGITSDLDLPVAARLPDPLGRFPFVTGISQNRTDQKGE